MANSLKVVKVELPIWAGTLHSLDGLSGLTGELTLEKKYPKRSA
jgi:hypothetical protein